MRVRRRLAILAAAGGIVMLGAATVGGIAIAQTPGPGQGQQATATPHANGQPRSSGTPNVAGPAGPGQRHPCPDMGGGAAPPGATPGATQ
ncbi:MAG TPA: hypothetical protein VH916_12820 [Dehalococcoidia bacterium]|jgi:hypothetical protein